MNLQRLEALETRNKKLISMIDSADQAGNSAYELKRELHQNKIEMIDIITVEEKRNGITARELRRLVEMRPKAVRYETGIRPLDERLNGGIEVGTFIQLAGESFVGKTHLTLEILSNVANYTKAIFFNFEMGDTRIVRRLKRLLKSEAQWDNLIIDNDSIDLETLCNEITLYARDGIKFFCIDSKMKIVVQGADKEHEKVSKVSKTLARVAQKNDIIVFLINQMSEEDIKGKRLAFKGSGDQKYDADIALFYINDENETRNLICTKNRQDETLFSIKTQLDTEGRTIEAGIQIEQRYAVPGRKAS